MKRIGIIGGSGYIGSHLSTWLAKYFDVTVLQRNTQTIMPRDEKIAIQPLDTDQHFDIIINTSYNLDKNINRVYSENETVTQTIQRLSHAHTQVIHLSSLAVFGFGLDKPIQTTALPLEHDYDYVLSKVHMENSLLNTIPHERLSIIRLGNVWGPANNSWTQPVADAIQWGLPVLSTSPAFSNITYIDHICDYIAFVIRHQEHRLFHHLAEFSHISWSQIVIELAKHFGAEPTPIKQIPFYATSLRDDLKNSLQPDLKKAFKNFRDGRFSSAYYPAFLISLLLSVKQKKGNRSFHPAPYNPDPTYYWILSCSVEFKSELLPGWNPILTWAEAEQKVAIWLRSAGYISEIAE
jgi:nucleoside-diphosphate-sugar epimerase